MYGTPGCLFARGAQAIDTPMIQGPVYFETNVEIIMDNRRSSWVGMVASSLLKDEGIEPNRWRLADEIIARSVKIVVISQTGMGIRIKKLKPFFSEQVFSQVIEKLETAVTLA